MISNVLNPNKGCWRLDPAVNAAAQGAVCITGTARSGTTLLGSLVHSLQNVELAFEPPLLVNLFTRAKHIPEGVWSRLYAEYLYEDILLGSLSARNLNFNEQDWSCVFHAKPRQEIYDRWSNENRRRNIRLQAQQHCVAYKIPNISQSMGRLLKNFPGTRVVVTIRDPDEVARSVCERQWFDGDHISYHTAGAVRYSADRAVPACLVGLAPSMWLALGELERCHAIYAGCYQAWDHAAAIVVDYEKLLRQPRKQVEVLAQKLGIPWGELTGVLVDNIRRPRPKKTASSATRCLWRERAYAAYEELKKQAI